MVRYGKMQGITKVRAVMRMVYYEKQSQGTFKGVKAIHINRVRYENMSPKSAIRCACPLLS